MKIRQVIKSIFLLFFISLMHQALAASASFQVSARILQPLEARADQSLQAPEQLSSAKTTSVLVNPQTAMAARLSAVGSANSRVFASVNNKRLALKCNSGDCKGEKLNLSGFKFGGSLAANGAGQFNRDGHLNNIKIGALETIPAGDKPGTYKGNMLVSIVTA